MGKKLLTLGIPLVIVALIAVILFLNRHNIAEHHQLAAGEAAVAKHVADPLDMSAQYTRRAIEQGDSYWTECPWHFQVFNGVPLQIDGMMYLWGAGNAEKGANFAEEILGIPVNKKFQTLYVYHCAFFSAPANTPVYELVFRYDDGSSVTNQMLYGRDVLDFNTRGKVTPPAGTNSRIAWTGSSFIPDKPQPLRFILTAIKNPEPDVTVATIDLYSCKSRSAACVMAMTAGPDGLMK